MKQNMGYYKNVKVRNLHGSITKKKREIGIGYTYI